MGIRRLHHVAILTRDIERALDHYAQFLTVERPTVTRVARNGLRLRTAMIPTGPGADTYLQLIEPEEGPGAQELAASGEGTLFEVAFEVVDLAGTTASLRESGVEPLDYEGRAIAGPFSVAASGNRFAYLPAALTRGTRTELVEPRRAGTEDRR